MNHYDDRTEALLKERFHVLDVLPRQVSAERGAAWFAAERWLLQRPRLEALYARFASVLIRLSCYYDLAVADGGAWLDRPEPEELEARIHEAEYEVYPWVLGHLAAGDITITPDRKVHIANAD